MRTRSTTRPRSAIPTGTTDPCPVCGTPQAEHWRCARCGARGHLMPRSTTQPQLCSWCVRDDADPGWHSTDADLPQ